MVIARLLALGLASASLSVSSEETGGLPTGKLVVQVMHQTWPDGSPVEHGGRNYPTDIYAVDTNGKHVRNLTHDAPTNYLIGPLPGGRRILYESVPSDRMRAGPSGIFSINADGSGRQQLASGKGELLPQLSPDGRRILFTRGRWLYVMRSDGTHKTALVQTSIGHYTPSTLGLYDASWSPDGERIVFVRGFAKPNADWASLRSALYVINADGTGLRRLTKLRPKVRTSDPAWSPDGRKIAFIETRYRYPAGNDERTYVMRADGTDVKRLKQLGANLFWLSNDRLCCGRAGSVDANGTGKPRAVPNRVRVGGNLWITSGRSAGFWPVSPDRKWIAYLGGGSFAGRDIWIAHLDGTHRRLVTRKICCWLDPGLREPFANSAVAWADK
jgi:Tol biopolymer transport system component